MHPRSKHLTAVAALLALALAAPAGAQWAPSYQAIKGMDETFRIDIGGFFQKFDATLQFYRPDGSLGNEWNVDDFLGESANKTTIRIDGMWRFGRHGNLQFGYRGWSQSNDHILTREIEFQGEIYQVGAQVSSKMRQNIVQLYYGYSFLNDGELELGTLLGIGAYFNNYSISASGSVTGPGGGTSGAQQSSSDNFVAPIPAIGTYFNFTLLPRFFVFAKVKWLPKVTISGYSGEMIDVVGGLDIYFTQNVGIGGAYEYSNITYTHAVTGGVHLNSKYSGPLAYLTLAF